MVDRTLVILDALVKLDTPASEGANTEEMLDTVERMRAAAKTLRDVQMVED